MERKLATIRKVKELKPIKEADLIELAIIDGWQCVVKKGEFKEGDLGIYFEIDSLLPIRTEFAFLQSNGVKTTATGEQGYRLKTKRMKGEISQGLILPLSTFELDKVKDIIEEGDDVTEHLGIVKYEAPIPAQLQGQVKGSFPSFIIKTDAERIQNIYAKYKEKYSDATWEVTEKIDGTSTTFYLKDGVFGVCSRNMELEEVEGNTYWNIAKQYRIEEFLRSLNKNIAIQGEIFGEGIQKNPLKIKGQQFRIFNIFDIDKYMYLPYYERLSTVQAFGLFLYEDMTKWEELHAPIISENFTEPFERTVDQLLHMVEINSSINPNCLQEGYVFKHLSIPEINFKVISNKYLLKHE